MIGQGIATLAVWAAVAIVGHKDKEGLVTIVVALIAMFATIAVWVGPK